ncbi:RICIN domain-containing protein, partial [Actinacidiphila rubida]
LVLAAPHPAGASVGGGNVSISWSIPNTPASGLTTLTFPLTVNPATAHQDGIYFAQQFSFQKNVAGYTGLQPRANSGGHERLHGVFSVFGDGTTTSDPHCSAGADGGSGVSCAVEFDGVYGHQYALNVARTGTDTWSGSATDTVTGTSVHIGTYTVPAGSGNLQGSQGGFVEYYLGIPSCATMPRSDAVFGGPTSTDAGGLSGTSTADYEYSDCVGQSGYQAQQVGSGTHVTRGFVSAAAALTHQASGRCLDDANSGTTDGNPVILYDCTGGANQQWAQPGGNELTVNGMCLDATAGGTTPGTKAEIWDCHGGTNQQWTFAADGTVRGVQSGLCLGPVGNATGNGTGVELQTCDGRASQVWSRG